MVKRTRETGSDNDNGSATPSTTHNTIFVDTTLDTHLVLMVSDDETVSDFKKKIMFEHPKCFTEIGEIEIHALKVKRKGYFYRLSDSMLVKSAFAGAKRSWFLSVDASRLNNHNDNLNSYKPDAGNQLALLCINYPPGDRNNLLTGCPSNGFSLIDEPLLSQPVSIQHANMRVADADQSGAIYSCKQVSKDWEMEVKHITDEHCEKSTSAINRLDLDIQEKYDLSSEETRVPRKNAKHKDGNFRDGICDAQCNNSLVGSLDKMPAAKKKRKIKNNGDEVCHPVFNENFASSLSCSKDTSHPEVVGTKKSSGCAGREKSNDTTVGNKNISEEPCKNDKSKNRTSDVQGNISLKEASQSGLRTMKKRKIESKESSGTPLKQNKDLVSNYGEETSKPETVIPENSKEDKQKRKTAASDSLAVSWKEKQCEPLQEVVEGNKAPSSIGTKMNEADIGTVGDKYASKLAAGAGKGTKKLMKHSATDVKGTSSVLVRDPDNLKKDSIHSGHENIIPDDQNIEKDQTDKIEEEKELSQNHDPEVLLSERCKRLNHGEVDMNIKEANISANLSDANIVMESGSETARKKKKKRAKKSLEHSDNPVDDISSTVPHSSFSIRLDDEAKKEESILSQSRRTQVPEPNKVESSFAVADGKGDDVSGNDAEPLPPTQINENKENAGSMDQILRKKSKKNRSSTTKTLLDLPIEERGNEVEPIQLNEINRTQENAENVDEEVRKETKMNNNSTAKSLRDLPLKEQPVGVEELASSNDRIREEDAPSKMKKRTRSVKTSVVNQLTGTDLGLERDADTECASLPVKERGNEVAPIQLSEINRTQENAENVVEEVRKETKGNRNSTAKSLRDLPIKEPPVGVEELTSSNDRIRVEDTPSKMKKRTRSVKTSVVNQLSGTDLGLERDADTECASVHPQLPSSEKLEGDSVRRPLEANVDDIAFENCCMDSANNQMSNSKCEDDNINFKDYFVPEKTQHEVALEVFVDSVDEAKRSDKELKAKKSIKKPVTCRGTSPDPNNPLNSQENLGSEKKLKGGISSSIQLQGSLSKEEHSEVMLRPKKKSSKVSGNEVKVVRPQNIDQIKSICEVVRRSDVVNGARTNGSASSYLKDNGKSSTASISSSESSKRSAQKKKHYKHQSSLDRCRATTAEGYHKNAGGIREKRLLATPRAIFRDSSSDSSEDENGPGNSDASTRTPSDNSSSSGYSEGESQSSLDSLQNGSHGVKGKKDGGKKNVKSVSLSGPKNITLDTILRSSSRFKKAKLSASQSQLGDTESQPVDFVPDSQTNL